MNIQKPQIEGLTIQWPKVNCKGYSVLLFFFIISINKTLNATQVSISNRLIMNQLYIAVIQIKF